MKQVMTGKIDDSASLPIIVPIVSPTSAGYFTNFDLQLMVGDDVVEDPIMISFGRSLDDAKERLATGSGISEISNMKGVVVFQTDLMASDLANSVGGSSSETKVYHFHSKKKLYVSGRFDLMEFRYESNSVPPTGKMNMWILTYDYVPYRNSNSISRKMITNVASSEFSEAQALVVPFDIKNPKLKVTVRAQEAAAQAYQMNDIYIVVVPERYKSTFVTNATATGQTLIKAITDNRTRYGVNYAMAITISTFDGSSGIAVGSKYLNQKLNAGDRIFPIYNTNLQSEAVDALEVDIELEGQVIYDGEINYVRAQFRDGSEIVPSDLVQLISKTLGGGL